MATRKARRPTASAADLSFIRGLMDDARELRWLRRMLLRRIQLMRKRVVERAVNALYRRYTKYTKRMVNRPGFLEWLDSHRYMHETYNYHSYALRYYWSSRPVALASRYELSFDVRLGMNDRADDSWYFEELQLLINAKEPSTDSVLKVRKEYYGSEAVPEPHFILKQLKKAS